MAAETLDAIVIRHNDIDRFRPEPKDVFVPREDDLANAVSRAVDHVIPRSGWVGVCAASCVATVHQQRNEFHSSPTASAPDVVKAASVQFA